MVIQNPDHRFWKGKKVLITGHTGFKGAWMSMLLTRLQADIFGYALPPPTKPSLYELANLDEWVHSHIGDIRDLDALKLFMKKVRPDIILHMAAQPLVRLSYADPLLTYTTNLMGTVNLFEAIREIDSVRSVVIITTDKCYENNEKGLPFIETDPLGGFDPYSSSKACTELITSAYRNSFFHPDKYSSHQVGIASARAGNVIGGGDWATDRLIPDILNAIALKKKINIRNPDAIRPWQFVLEPLTGYLLLAEKLFEKGNSFSGAFNFGPDMKDLKTVAWITEYLCRALDHKPGFSLESTDHPHESSWLSLNCNKANNLLHWFPRWNIINSLTEIIEFNASYQQQKHMRPVCMMQIDRFLNSDNN